MSTGTTTAVDCVIIGGGQSALACGYYLHRHNRRAKSPISFVIVDANDRPGGSWQHTWPSLTLFSPSNASNLPGWPMPHYDGFPPASHVVDYLSEYERRYELPIQRPVRVTNVAHDGTLFTISGDTPAGQAAWVAPTVVAATGTWESPFVPHYPGRFNGGQFHTVNYPGPEYFHGKKVAVVGGANSGAQIAAELALDPAVSSTTWFTTSTPRWMPDEVDGRVLFQRNRERLNAMQRSEPDPGSESELGDIVMVPPVLRARNAGKLEATPMFASLDELNEGGAHPVDCLIWATGFRPALRPLRALLERNDSTDELAYNATVPHLHLLGYGSWTGPGSATITGVSPFAKGVAEAVINAVGKTG